MPIILLINVVFYVIHQNSLRLQAAVSGQAVQIPILISFPSKFCIHMFYSIMFPFVRHGRVHHFCQQKSFLKRRCQLIQNYPCNCNNRLFIRYTFYLSNPNSIQHIRTEHFPAFCFLIDSFSDGNGIRKVYIKPEQSSVIHSFKTVIRSASQI